MSVDDVVVGEAGGELLQDGDGVWARVHPDVVGLEGLREGLADAVAFRAADRREARDEVQRGREVHRLGRGVGRAVVREPLDRLRGADGVEPALDASSIMSGIISPLMPAPTLATHAMTSRSWVSIAKATRTASLFQQGISKPSDAQRWLDAAAMTVPSCARMARRPVWGCSSNEACRMMRKTRL